MENRRNVLGLDPGFANVGWSILSIAREGLPRVEDMGVFQTVAAKNKDILVADDNFRRAMEISKFLDDTMLRWRPVFILAESMSFTPNASASAKVSMGWGVLALLSYKWKVPLLQASPQAIRKVIVPDIKKATKDDIGDAIWKLYPNMRYTGDVLKPPGMSHADWVRSWEHSIDSVAAATALIDHEDVHFLRRAF